LLIGLRIEMLQEKLVAGTALEATDLLNPDMKLILESNGTFHLGGLSHLLFRVSEEK